MTRKQKKNQIVRNLLSQSVYRLDSGVYRNTEKGLLALSLVDLTNLELILSLKSATVEVSEVPMPEVAKYIQLDVLAECYDGIGAENPLYCKLWSLLDSCPERPSGGDGSNGTIETPPEPDAYPESSVGAHWSSFTTDEQKQIVAAIEKGV